MLRLFAAVEHALIRAPASDNRSALFANSWLRLAEYGRSVERLVTEKASSAEERDFGVQALGRVFETYALLAKSFIDQSPGETSALREINGYLDGFLRHWDPEHRGPHEWELDHRVSLENGPRRDVERLRSLLVEKQAQVAAKVELVTRRATQRFALLALSLRKLRESGTASMSSHGALSPATSAT